ncbi:heavy-metal-associated domain-containing protein [Xylophilus sp.]|uniref:heavy-metal-associated domain-containing protein n=1 Tax=Xylophilus sp. TaxID=2653893 RepID=UPI0013BA841F|nr:heavy-metal-associated domain-containing protein [Xylophilus sp.]KAF1048559.1 MAG: hypothetical protein GAK38_01310 [Xylophilus sp.]
MPEFTIPAISCQHCVRSVTEAARRVDPGAQVTVDLPTRHVTIDSARPAADFVAELTQEGYPPQA